MPVRRAQGMSRASGGLPLLDWPESVYVASRSESPAELQVCLT